MGRMESFEHPDPATPGIERDLRSLQREELMGLYQSAVGVDPTYRAFDDETLARGIENPAAEKQRLHELDTAENSEDLNEERHP